MNVSILSRIFQVFLGVFSLFLFFGISNAAVIETTGEDSCNRIDTIDLGDGWSVKHFSLHADRHVNVGRTEVYYNNERLEFHDTVFYANSRWTWWYSAPSCATHSKISSASFNNGILDLSFDSFNPQSGPGFGTYATTTRARLDSNPLQLNIGKQEIDAIVINPYAIGSGFNHVMKLNLFSSGSHVGGTSIRTEAFVGQTDARSGTRLSSAYYYGHSGCSLGDVNQNDDEYVINFTCGLTFTKTSSAINGSGYTRTNNYEGSFSLSKERYDLCSYDEQLCEDSLPVPTNLSQSIRSPELNKEEIDVGEQIGKFQSGSGVIFNVDVENPDNTPLKLAIKYSINGGTDQIEYSDSFTSGSGELILPYSGAGDYIWSAAISNEDETELSEWMEFKDNYGETDFTLYEGFEPYPYGYKFYNSQPESGLLTGGIAGWTFNPLELFYKRRVKEGTKWDVFHSAFNTDSFVKRDSKGDIIDDTKLLSVFEALGMDNNEPDVFNGGNCFGMALSSLMVESETGTGFLFKHHNDFYNNLAAQGNIWSLGEISKNNSNEWDDEEDANKMLQTILAFQLSLQSQHIVDIGTIGTKTPTKILKTLQDNPDKKYIMIFSGLDRNNEESVHAVVPYRTEIDQNGDKRVFIWDNNTPFPNRLIDGINYKGYNQFLQINSDTDWYVDFYKNAQGWKEFHEIALLDLEDIKNDSKKWLPAIGLSETDASYSLVGEADLYLEDLQGRISGYKDGMVIKEIPGVQIIEDINLGINSNSVDKYKLIYLPEKIDDIVIHVNGTKSEDYNLMIAGGNYYTKIEGVTTELNQEDLYISTENTLEINFDNNKQGTHNFLSNYFGTEITKTVYVEETYSSPMLQKYSMDWGEVGNNEENVVEYQIDNDGDGVYDIYSNFGILPQSANLPGRISGYVQGDKNMAGWKVYLDMNNDGKLQENIEPFDVTDNTGYYEFTNLERGDYSVKELPHINWEITTPVHKAYDIYLNSGQSIKNLNFENIKNKKNKHNITN